jgi:hypothetical protein
MFFVNDDKAEIPYRRKNRAAGPHHNWRFTLPYPRPFG